MGKITNLKDIVQEAIKKGATTVEEVHQSISKLPLDVLEKLEPLEEHAKKIKKVQDDSIGSIYNLIRDINQKAGDFATELLNKAKK